MHLDYIIIGQGIAGSVLGHELITQGKKIAVIDEVQSPAASQIAAGIINPVTGRRLVKSWLIDDLIPVAKSFYEGIEKKVDASFFHPKTIVRVFENVREQNDFLSKTADPKYQKYLTDKKDWPNQDKFDGDLGQGFIENAFQLDVPLFLEQSRQFFTNQATFIDRKLDYDAIEFNKEGIALEQFGLQAKQVIFCEGAGVRSNPFFRYLPFTPARGAFFLLEIEDLNTDFLVKKGVMVAPTNKKNVFWAGATYDHRNLKSKFTQKDQDYLQEKLDQLLLCPYEILDSQSGIRPATQNRRPLIGVHPEHSQLAIFNGMGSKGISLSPYFAQQFVRFLEGKEELNEDVQLN